jgi:hypothetical protein
MNKRYVEKANDIYQLIGTHVLVDSIVYAFW